MAKCTHLVVVDRFPLTCCGVDIEVKTGAEWVLQGDGEPEPEYTCTNCAKVRGKEVRVQEKQVEKEEKAYWEDPMVIHVDRLYQLKTKLNILVLDIRGQSPYTLSPEEKKELEWCAQWVERAENSIDMAIHEARSVIKTTKKEEENSHGELES